jgi:hypothetical protein
MARSFAYVVIAAILVPLVLASAGLEAEDVEAAEPLFEQDLPADPVMSASGDVLFIGDGESKDVYIMLGNGSERTYELTASPRVQGTVEIGVPVTWTQNLTINASENTTINLWNHADAIPHSFLSDVLEMEIMLEGELISEVPIIQIREGYWTVEVMYFTPAVEREIVCEKQTVRDLLPPGAQVISSDLTLDTYVQEVCRIRLFHESHTPYEGVSFTVSEIDRESIVSIYSVERDEYLFLRNDSLYVPRR